MTKLSIPLLVLAAALTGCLRQKPPETVPDATLPDGTPIVRQDSTPRPRQIVPTAADRESPFYIQGLLTGHITSNTIEGGGVNPDPAYNGTMVGIEGALLPLRGRGIGVGAKAITGGANSPLYTDIELLFGSRELALGFGLGSRRANDIRTGGAYDSTFTFFSPAVRSRVNLGATGLSLASRAVRYFNLPEAGTPESNFWGWHAEAALAWTAPGRRPLTATLGYRHEVVRLYNRRHSLGSLVFGGGMILGRQPVPLTAADSARRR